MFPILLDENLEGFADFLSRCVYSSEWSEVGASLGVSFVTFSHVSLPKGTPDEQVWQFCQDNHHYLLTDNRNEDSADSLEAIIKSRNLASSLPVFTISDVNRLRFERDYVAAVIVKLLGYAMDEGNIRGAGRLYLP